MELFKRIESENFIALSAVKQGDSLVLGDRYANVQLKIVTRCFKKFYFLKMD